MTPEEPGRHGPVQDTLLRALGVLRVVVLLNSVALYALRSDGYARPLLGWLVVGTDVVAPPGQTFGKFTRPIVRFGAPLDFSRYEGMQNDRYILRSVTDEIMRLSGQEYVDVYASKAKDAGKEKGAEPEKKAS